MADCAGRPLRMLVSLLVSAPPDGLRERLGRTLPMGLNPGACKAAPAPPGKHMGQHCPEIR
eukprot:404580-Alexandrium_andersonii.AAC.1